MSGSDPLGATILETSRENAVSANSESASVCPQFQMGGHVVRFSEETAALLRDRLSTASLLLAAVLAFAMTLNLFSGNGLITLPRGMVLLVLIGCHLLLRSKKTLSLRQLMILEFVVFGGMLVQLALQAESRMSQYTAHGDIAAVIGAGHVFSTTICILMLTYGLFIPNTWRRAATVVFPVSIVQPLVISSWAWSNPSLSEALAKDRALFPVPFPVITAVIVVVGAHSINRIRRAAYDARRLGQYVLKDRIGKGGMGEVFRAEHTLLKRPCAVKLIRPEKEADAKALARFELEVRATARLSHWNTVEIFDYGHTDDGTFYYVMELLPGHSLEDLVQRDGPMPAARAVHFLIQVCSALREAHAIGLIHRDIKPANIYASERGGVFDVAKLIDFGLVKQTGGEINPTAEFKGISGSPLYMPPEQACDPAAIDVRSDIYAVGGVAYFLVTGEPPFIGSTLMELINAHASQPVTPPNVLAPDLPDDVNALIVKCLSKSQSDRFQSASELLSALRSCSCANQWSDEDAAACWKHEVTAPRFGTPGLQDNSLPETDSYTAEKTHVN